MQSLVRAAGLDPALAPGFGAAQTAPPRHAPLQKTIGPAPASALAEGGERDLGGDPPGPQGDPREFQRVRRPAPSLSCASCADAPPC